MLWLVLYMDKENGKRRIEMNEIEAKKRIKLAKRYLSLRKKEAAIDRKFFKACRDGHISPLPKGEEGIKILQKDGVEGLTEWSYRNSDDIGKEILTNMDLIAKKVRETKEEIDNIIKEDKNK